MKFAQCLTLLTLAITAFATGEGWIMGVESDLQEQYRKAIDGGEFECLDGSKKISGKRVNNDRCDCPDGSDEPGTAACANGSFTCQQIGFRAHRVPASFVNDGLCDCCDGQDEWVANQVSDASLLPSHNKDMTLAVQCRNFCAEALEKWRAEAAERIGRARVTIERRAEMEARGAKKLLTLEGKIKEYSNTVEEKRKQVKELDQVVMELEAAYNSAKQADDQRQEEWSQRYKDWKKQKEAGVEGLGSSFGTPRPEMTKAEQDVTNRYNEAFTKRRDIRIEANEIRDMGMDLEKLLRIDYGEDKALFDLFEECFDFDGTDRRYEVCIMQAAYLIKDKNRPSEKTLVGLWNKKLDLDAGSLIHRPGAQTCRRGKKWSAKIDFSCGSENTIIDAYDSDCRVYVTFATPAWCKLTEADIPDVQQLVDDPDHPFHGHDEL
eukprot:Clim_evm35s136 gene=Clim_evmTU35s136